MISREMCKSLCCIVNFFYFFHFNISDGKFFVPSCVSSNSKHSEFIDSCLIRYIGLTLSFSSLGHRMPLLGISRDRKFIESPTVEAFVFKSNNLHRESSIRLPGNRDQAKPSEAEGRISRSRVVRSRSMKIKQRPAKKKKRKNAKETFSLSTEQAGIAFRWRLHVLRAKLRPSVACSPTDAHSVT